MTPDSLPERIQALIAQLEKRLKYVRRCEGRFLYTVSLLCQDCGHDEDTHLLQRALEALLASQASGWQPIEFAFDVVVNGQPVSLTLPTSATVRDAIDPALALTGTVSRPESEWEMRLTKGQPLFLDQPIAPFVGQRLWVNLRAGYAATVALSPQSTRRIQT